MSEENTKNIFKQLPKIISDIDAIQKTKRDGPIKYAYRSIDEFMNVINPLLGKYGVVIIPEILKNERMTIPTSNGGKMISVVMEIKYTFYADDGSHVSCVMIGEAFDSGDKASNKAQSVALKYALMQVFMVPTEEDIQDPDNHDTSDIISKTNFSPKEHIKDVDNFIKTKGTDIKNYVVRVGKFKNKKLSELEHLDIQKYLVWLNGQAKDLKKPLSGDALEFAKIAEAYISGEYGST